ncbi:hypothetical protein [Actinophytocola oryzae]|uniref:Uncharacterized protein n=1 Tax=Actinophytocola oryzae TaxID=502181 RepID=A0A4R7UVK1_9PSEU|nr:hypothetical protein [Actinophytocola oryzae]TDV40074.1 hypothetical protein CLV71_12491 [Actinophytocola oryzae]
MAPPTPIPMPSATPPSSSEPSEPPAEPSPSPGPPAPGSEPGADPGVPADGERIHGIPGVMEGTDIRGPGLMAMDAEADLQPGMEEGIAFVAKDRDAMTRLTKFFGDTNIGYDAYTNTARNAGHSYLASDDAASARINDITQNIYR